jgi:hypothetical protein
MYTPRQRELLGPAATGSLSHTEGSLEVVHEEPASASPNPWQRRRPSFPRAPSTTKSGYHGRTAPSPRQRAVTTLENGNPTKAVRRRLSGLKSGGKPTGMACSLDSIVAAYEENRKTLDHMSRSFDSKQSVHSDMDSELEVIALGQNCEVFSGEAKGWIDAEVIDVDVRSRLHIVIPTT